MKRKNIEEACVKRVMLAAMVTEYQFCEYMVSMSLVSRIYETRPCVCGIRMLHRQQPGETSEVRLWRPAAILFEEHRPQRLVGHLHPKPPVNAWCEGLAEGFG